MIAFGSVVGKRKHDAGEMLARIVAKRLADHLDRCGFVVVKKLPIEGGAALGRGFEEGSRA